MPPELTRPGGILRPMKGRTVVVVRPRGRPPRAMPGRPRTCPDGHPSRLILWGRREWTSAPFRRQRMRCLPADGTKAHTFSLPRRQNTPDHPHGEDCSVCDVRPAPTQGPLSLVDFFHTGGEIVRLWTPGLPILTTNHVVGETWTFLRRRDGHPSAVTFLAAVESAAWLTVVHVEEAIEREPRAWLKRHNERVYSFVDATSFAVMRRERLREALAFDDDFSAAGFVEVRPAI